MLECDNKEITHLYPLEQYQELYGTIGKHPLSTQVIVLSWQPQTWSKILIVHAHIFYSVCPGETWRKR